MNLGGTIHLNKKRCFFLSLPFIILVYYLISRSHVYKFTVGPQVNLKRLLEVSIKASLGGGLQVVKYSEHFLIENKGKTKEGANMSVTTADRQSHCVMVETIRTAYPDMSIVSEEESRCDEGHSTVDGGLDQTISALEDRWVDAGDVNVWIDPLDATQEYTGEFPVKNVVISDKV